MPTAGFGMTRRPITQTIFEYCEDSEKPRSFPELCRVFERILSGFMSGKSGNPTPIDLVKMTGLRGDCRECRVSIGEESCWENRTCPERVNATSTVLASILDSGWTPKR